MRHLPAILLLLAAASPLRAEDIINSGPRADIDRADYAEVDRHGVCRMVLNNTGRDVMIPIRTPEEWYQGAYSFLGARPDDMGIKACPPSVTPTSGLRIYPHNYDRTDNGAADEGDAFGMDVWVSSSGNYVAISSPNYSTAESPNSGSSKYSGRIVIYRVEADGSVTRVDTFFMDPQKEDRLGNVFDIADDRQTIVTGYGSVFEKIDGSWTKVFQPAWPYDGTASDIQISADGTKAAVSLTTAMDNTNGDMASFAILLHKAGGTWRQTRLRFPAEDWTRIKMTPDGSVFLAQNDISRNSRGSFAVAGGFSVPFLVGGEIQSSVIRKYELVSGSWTQTKTFRPFGTDPVSIDHFQITDDESRIVIMGAPFGWDPAADGDLVPAQQGEEFATEPPFIATFDVSGTSWVLTNKQRTSTLGIRGAKFEDAARTISSNDFDISAPSVEFWPARENDIFKLSASGETIWAAAPTRGWVQLRDPDRDGVWTSYPAVIPLDYSRDRMRFGEGAFGPVYDAMETDATGTRLLTADVLDSRDPSSDCVSFCGSGYLFDFRR